ncbi:VWA domain-containing protein [uncultured Tateyamaria sp.]|uniref:vWA domain-containing protein n=1 Tax=uncultured Tateyamaria sp. TaxID=455651 RepID=UPI00263930DD|nr:VWA domain-containing protein [uncultured Tateyamaria sp.]
MIALRPLMVATALAATLPTMLSATGCARDAMLVFDGSASMDELSFDVSRKTRIVDARTALRDALPDITPFRRVGLLTYGPGASADSCANIDLRFGPRADAAAAIVDQIDTLQPKGLTALAASVRAAADALDHRNRSGIVVLVTDGNETCGGRPCALGTALAQEAADLTVHVIGFQVVVDFFSWDNPEQVDVGAGNTVAKCLADRTGGLYVSTDTVDELADALRATLGCALIGAVPQAPIPPFSAFETPAAPRRQT